MHPLTYLHLQMGLEGVGLIGDRLMRELDAGPDGILPLLLMARLSTREIVVYYNQDLPPGTPRKLSAILGGTKFPDVRPVLKALELDSRQVKVGHSITHIFLNNSGKSFDGDVGQYSGNSPQVTSIGYHGQAEHLFGIECDGRVVSACVSARENEHCGKAWVFTDPAYRNRGHASKVVQAWANSLISVGKIPFYSHEAGDAASAGLVKRLGLHPVFEEINISYR